MSQQDDEKPPKSNPPPAVASGKASDEPRRPRRLMTLYDVIVTALLLGLWLAPITYVGAANRDVRFLPNWLRHQHRVSCLFINEVRGWQTYRTEVQLGGSQQWQVLDDKNFFDMPVFGYRSRLHRLLGHSYRRGKGLRRLRDVAHYIKAKHTELFPDKPPLDAVRFVRIYMTNEMLAKQSGRFKPMAPSEVPKNYVLVFGETRFDGKRATDGGFGRSAKSRSKKKTPRPPASQGGRR